MPSGNCVCLLRGAAIAPRAYLIKPAALRLGNFPGKSAQVHYPLPDPQGTTNDFRMGEPYSRGFAAGLKGFCGCNHDIF
jgi:hypothetical protein